MKNNNIKMIRKELEEIGLKIHSIEGIGLDYKKINTAGFLPGASSFSGKNYKDVLNKIIIYKYSRIKQIKGGSL